MEAMEALTESSDVVSSKAARIMLAEAGHA